MTGEVSFETQEGYEYWHIFKAQVILRFTISHKGETALRTMDQVNYQWDIEKYVQDLENLNIVAQVTGIGGVFIYGREKVAFRGTPPPLQPRIRWRPRVALSNPNSYKSRGSFKGTV